MKLELKKGDQCPFFRSNGCRFPVDCPTDGLTDDWCNATRNISIEITVTPVKSEFEALLDEMIAVMDNIYYNQPHTPAQATKITVRLGRKSCSCHV